MDGIKGELERAKEEFANWRQPPAQHDPRPTLMRLIYALEAIVELGQPELIDRVDDALRAVG